MIALTYRTRNQCDDLPITKVVQSDNTLGGLGKDNLVDLWTPMGQMQAKTLFIIWISYDFILLGELLDQFGPQGVNFSFDSEFNKLQKF